MNTQLVIIENFTRESMNSKLCRHCGEETLEADKCKTCNQVFKFVCPECNIVYEEHHTNCIDTRVMQKIIIE